MQRHKHNLSHYRLATFDMGQLVPVGCVEVLPGDTFRHTSSCMVRAATMVAPLMHPVTVRLHHWYVPHRLVWADFDDFITGKNTGLTFPTISGAPASDSLGDHLGLPTGSGIQYSALPVRAYNLIYNFFYRDQDLMAERAQDTVTLARIAWEKDYYTSARTYPQFGSTTMSIPFSTGQARISGIGLDMGSPTTASAQLRETSGVTPTVTQSTDPTQWGMKVTGSAPNVFPEIYAELGSATGGIDVNALRRSLALQKFLEARNRYGTRYRDYLRYLGIRPADGRLEEPEYLGGGKQQIAFSEVLATADNGGTVEVGDMSGHGIAAMRTRPYTRFFEEPGYMLSLMSVRPKAMYMNAVERHWLRRTKDDFWQKEYEAFGPQAVTVLEAYNAHPNTTDILGYVDRFREYREIPSMVTGDFRDTTSDYWHMARKLTGSPSLNESFVTCTPTDRIYADTGEPELRVMVRHKLTARRLVSKQARPM